MNECRTLENQIVCGRVVLAHLVVKNLIQLSEKFDNKRVEKKENPAIQRIRFM